MASLHLSTWTWYNYPILMNLYSIVLYLCLNLRRVVGIWELGLHEELELLVVGNLLEHLNIFNTFPSVVTGWENYPLWSLAQWTFWYSFPHPPHVAFTSATAPCPQASAHVSFPASRCSEQSPEGGTENPVYAQWSQHVSTGNRDVQHGGN